MRLLCASLATPVAGLLACGGNGGATSFTAMTEPAVTTVPNSGSSGSTGGTRSSTTFEGSGSTTTSADDSDTLVLDMGMPDFGSPLPKGCEGKIDFLFVVSASGTMLPHQQQLVGSFPGFIAAIQEQIPNFDVHILSASAGSSWPLDSCELCTGDGCDSEASPPACGADLDECDKELLGAGVTFPVGTGASNRRCDLYGGNRYIVADEPDLTEAFTCIAQVGGHGGDRTAEAMVRALSPELNAPLGCNEGFLREDALLVVTVIQDTYDEDSAGSVASWIEALRSAKHGDEDAFTVLVLTTDVDEGPWKLCWPEEYLEEKNKLRLLVEGVKHGSIGSICEKAYDPFFAEAVSSVVELCESFVPPG